MASTNNTKNKRTGGKKKYQLVNVDVWLKLNATINQEYMYTLALIRFNVWLLHTKSGDWGGKETLVMSKKREAYGLKSYFFIRHDRAKAAVAKLDYFIKLYRVKSITKVTVGPPQRAKQEWIKSIAKQIQIGWSFPVRKEF